MQQQAGEIMARPIALVGHMHTCPIHGRGPVLNPGQASVRFNGIPLAVEGGHMNRHGKRTPVSE
ncbi:PAAR domain-containing protein [Paracoccus halophilus]|uniref:PAAR domain-containing protein n=2 Tax=Paracoccus halophilus TaxID=376733 RepID=UPI0009E01CAF